MQSANVIYGEYAIFVTGHLPITTKLFSWCFGYRNSFDCIEINTSWFSMRKRLISRFVNYKIRKMKQKRKQKIAETNRQLKINCSYEQIQLERDSIRMIFEPWFKFKFDQVHTMCLCLCVCVHIYFKCLSATKHSNRYANRHAVKWIYLRVSV